MNAYRNIELLFSDYFADDAGSEKRYASLRKSTTEELAIEKQMASAWSQAMVREENNGNKD